jgi:hypothetical protein
MRPTIAYLAQGKVRLKIGTAPPRTVESPYANEIREREVRAQQRNSWKTQGGGFLAGAALWGGRAAQGPTPVVVTSISGGAAPGRLIYSLESGSLCALLASGNYGDEERRLWNNNNFKLQHVRACPHTGDLAFSATHANGTANIGVMFKDENSVKELTEGDSVDTAPQWVPGKPRRLVFQSAGVGRDRQGHFLALGPFSLQELNLDTAEMNTLLEDAKTDFLAPQVTEDGTLYYIRRPYAPTEGISPWRAIKDFFLFPFRLLYAVFQFLNFFSMSFTGRKLSTAGDTKARELDMRQMMIYGNLIRAQQGDEAEAPDLVPGSWQLARRREGREEILARGVLAYDLAADGTIACSNGSAIFVIAPDGHKERIVSERMIEQVVLL